MIESNLRLFNFVLLQCEEDNACYNLTEESRLQFHNKVAVVINQILGPTLFVAEQRNEGWSLAT